MAKYHIISEEGDVSFLADADLTQKQYYAVMPASTDGNVALANGASNTTPLGILQNSPSAGQEARVRVLGFSKAVVENGTCVIKFGRYAFVASDGQFEMCTVAGSPANARYIGNSFATAGSIYGEMMLFPGGLATCPLAQI